MNSKITKTKPHKDLLVYSTSESTLAKVYYVFWYFNQ